MILLKKLCEAYGVSGCENEIRGIIKEEMKQVCDEIYSDTIGNLICRKKGNGNKIMFSAHMDCIGLMVTYIENSGFLRYAQVGNFAPRFAIGCHIKFENGCEGIISCEAEDNEKMTQDKMYIDIGASNKEDAEKKVSVGMCAKIISDFVEMNGKIASASIDNRVGCYALIEAAKRIQSDNDIYYVFTAQEKIGQRGAKCVAYSINPNCVVAIDTTASGDVPGAERCSVKGGDGAAIKVMDRSIITGARIRGKLIDAACDIPYQMEVSPATVNDGGAIYTSCGGIETGGISIPIRYENSQYEVVDKKDIESTMNLITKFAEEYNE